MSQSIIDIGCNLTSNKFKDRKAVVDRLMIETDAPFMSPPNRSRTNEPQYLWDVAETLAECYIFL